MKMKLVWGTAALLLLASFWLPLFAIQLVAPTEAARLDDVAAWVVWAEIWNAPTTWQRAVVEFLPIVYAVCLLFGAAYMTLLLRRRMEDARTSAVWAKKSELKPFLGTPGLRLTKRLTLADEFTYGHVLVVGPTGSGKSQSFFLPNLLKLDTGHSAVVMDPKGELYQTCAAALNARGWDTRLLKLDDYRYSEQWNPLDFARTSSEIDKLLLSLLANISSGEDAKWSEQAGAFVKSLVYAIKCLPKLGCAERCSADNDGRLLYPTPYGNFRNLAELGNALSAEALYGLSKFAVAMTKFDSLVTVAAGFRDGAMAEATRTSVQFFLKAALKPFFDHDLSTLTASSSFDIADLKHGTRPVALFISVAEHRVEPVKAALATFYMQCFDVLLNLGPEGYPVRFFLDEFANSGKIPGFMGYAATVRSRRLSISVCLQSIEQLVRVYGDSEKKEILNNLKTWVILPGLKERETLEYACAVAGEVGVMVQNPATGENEVLVKNRLPVAAIRGIADDYSKKRHQVIALVHNQNPFLDTQLRSYSDPECKSVVATHGKVELSQWSEDHYDEIRRRCFLSPEQLQVLDLVGTWLAYDGAPEKIGEQRLRVDGDKIALLEQSYLNGKPSFRADGPKLTVLWPAAKTELGKWAQDIITAALPYLYTIGLFKPETTSDSPAATPAPVIDPQPSGARKFGAVSSAVSD